MSVKWSIVLEREDGVVEHHALERSAALRRWGIVCRTGRTWRKLWCLRRRVATAVILRDYIPLSVWRSPEGVAAARYD